ncbi:hypothetical protein [Candidatus Symbiothrix dinenymphae]|uniref:hypothetical protein n=1 Tax=Candidatus Symbiothrix dinenymphae TaxID=467085 RepID=UPI00131535A8|nr:hypothetical protein [Candidatus Symbiothrix dinenymphae]
MYEDDTFVVVHPLTEAASCLYGRGTRWCTAATESCNLFNHYNSQGNLCIIINKKSGEKFQFHFATYSFMDETNHEIKSPMLNTIEATSGLIDFTLQKFIELWEDRESGDLADEFFHDFFGGNEGVHPKDKQAFKYVKSHVKTPFSDEEFLIIEKFFAEYHDSLYPDGIMGDGDTKNFIYRKLEATEQFIPQHRVDAIADALYEYACENDILLPVNEQTLEIEYFEKAARAGRTQQPGDGDKNRLRCRSRNWSLCIENNVVFLSKI